MVWLESKWTFTGATEAAAPGRIRLDRGVISEVVSSGSAKPSREGQAVALDGYCVMPGLIDAHSHLGLVVQPHGARGVTAIIAAQIFGNVERAIVEGFTTVRDLGGLDGGVGCAIDQGWIRGPEILPSGPLISQTGGHGDWSDRFAHKFDGTVLPGLVQGTVVVDGRDALLRTGRLALRDGAHQLKAAVSGGFSSDWDTIDEVQFSEDELRALVEVAKARHTYVTVHAHTSDSIRMALRSGVECIEHGTFADSEVLVDMARRGVPLVATLSTLQRYESEEFRGRLSGVKAVRAEGAFRECSRVVVAATEAGLAVGSGTDKVGPDQRGRGHEIAVRARVTSPGEAARAATTVNAQILRIDHRAGSLAPGLQGDLVAVRGNPLEDPELFDDPSRVELVVRGGKIMRNELPGPLAMEVEGALRAR